MDADPNKDNKEASSSVGASSHTDENQRDAKKSKPNDSPGATTMDETKMPGE
jgi:hypothetical protein